MDFRQLAIRTLYASIVIAVIAGVLVLFVPEATDTIGRLIATAISTAITSIVILVGIKAFESRNWQHVGVIICCSISCIYGLIFLAIWADLTPLRRIEGELALTSGILFVCTFPLIIGAACVSRGTFAHVGRSLLISWIAIAILWTLALWVDSSHLYVTAYILSIFTPVFALVLLNPHSRVRLLAMITALASYAGFEITAMASLDLGAGATPPFPFLFTASLILLCGSSIFGIFNLATCRNPNNSIKWVERVAIVFCAIAIVLLSVIAWLAIFDKPEPPFLLLRIAASSGILGTATLLSALVTQFLKARVFMKTSSSDLTASCPRCEQAISIPQGKSKCPYCSLHFKVQVEATGCRECNYDLSGSLESNCCPECGETIMTSFNTD